MWWLKSSAFLLTWVLLGMQLSFAQRVVDPEERPPLKDRMYYGGNFGLSFGTITFLDISPLAGVMITDKLSAGAGLTYQYFNDSRWVGLSNTLYGGRLFTRYNVLPNIFLHAEYETLNFELYNFETNTSRREWVDAFLVGGGYFVPFGNRGGANFMFLYNLNYDVRRSPYNEPYVIRVGLVL
ncbi:MAG: hypothetical protein ACXIUD_14105 [Mongoliitalea sp.]